MRRILLLIVVAATVGLAGCGGFTDETPDSPTPTDTSLSKVRQGAGTKDASADVRLLSFKQDPVTQTFTGVVEVVNHSEQTSDYYIEISIVDKHGTQVDEPATLVSGLDPHKKARSEFYSISVDSYKARISEVQRLAAS